MKNIHNLMSLVLIILIFCPVPARAEAEVGANVTQILNEQLDALKWNSYERFMKLGNKAFKELFTEYDFESVYLNTKSELAREYDLIYLGSIQRVGMIAYLWKFKNRDTQKEHLVRLTLSKTGEYVVGFDFD